MDANSAIAYGWCPDVPDFRDFPGHAISVDPTLDIAPSKVDLQEEGLEPRGISAGGIHASCAFVIVSAIDWQSRKLTGHSIDASASFLHRMTIQIAGGGGLQGVSLRSTLRILTQFGSPPEHLWPSTTDYFSFPPTAPELFCYSRPFHFLRYVRLDGWEQNPQQKLWSIRNWIASGNICVIGFSVPQSLFASHSDVIPFDPNRGGSAGGTACIVMGYDDELRLPFPANHPQVSERNWSSGAFRVKTCWGNSWGDNGYGWLPYAFIESQFARDAWAMPSAQWTS